MVSDFRPTVPSGVNDLFAGGGEMGELMRSIDWGKTPLGQKEQWPQSLRTSLSICLASRFPILIWWGSELVMLYNDAYRTILGTTKHPRSMGQRGQECWPEIWDVIGPMLEGVLNEGEATWSDDQLLLLNRNGYSEECYFTFSYSPIRDESGGIGGVFTAVTETTERVLGERRLRILRELAAESTEAQTAAEVCQLAIGTLAKNPNDLPFTLLYLLNQQGTQAQLVGSTGIADNTPASPLTVTLAGERTCASSRPLKEVVDSGKATLIEPLLEKYAALLPTPDGERLRSVLVLPLVRPGQEGLYGFLIVGISPRHALDDDYRSFFDMIARQIAANIARVQAYQEERARAEALAELDRAKTTFFSNVSHEFRTPLTLLLGPVADVLADQSLPTQQRERLEMVQRNALRLLKLVNSLLDFARIEAGRLEIVYEPVDLAAFTAELASNFRSAIERAGMHLIVDCPPLSEPVYVDREMWEKIVLNLLSNAFKFTFEGEIIVTLHSSEQAVELEVRDTGVGIPQEELPRIFERFHRVHNTRARTFEGTGIGLALVQELVRLHSGTIRASSRPGEGTTFTVSLPRGVAHLPAGRIERQQRTLSSTSLGAVPYVEEALRWLPVASEETTVSADWIEQSQTLAPAVAKPDQQQAARVLVVDDNTDMLEYIARLLNPYYTVVAVTDGKAALQAIEQNPPDLIISDVMMPELDGFQLLQTIRSKQHTSLLPVILLSARAGEEATIEGLQAGANDYLVKPFSARELLTRVAAHLEIARLFKQVQQALRTRDELFSLVTHDLKNPLGAIKGYAQLAHRQLTQANNPAQAQAASLLTRIDALSSRMTAQINELLEIAQLQSSESSKLSLRAVDLVALTRQIIAEHQQTTSHPIILTAVQESMGGQFDTVRLERILTNLLSNAIKYSPAGGQIEVSLEQQEEQGHPCAILRVRDSGIGIPAADLPHIFEPFHRAANVSGKFAGTGLGLSSVQQMVMRHGGTISVESQEQQGSTFTVHLPLDLETLPSADEQI